MKLNERLQLITLRIKKIQGVIVAQKKEISDLTLTNQELSKELERVKKENSELITQFEIANMANQLGNETETSTEELREKIDQYIREVDTVIEALKLFE